MRECWGVRSLVVVIVASVSGGCLAEYVLPGGSRGDTESNGGETMVSGDTPTMGGGEGEGDDSEGECAAGASRCGEACVDLQRDGEHCGGCGEVCTSDERCIVGECRDVVVLKCASCPCADQCPAGDDGVLASTTGAGEGEGDDPQQRLCCALGEEVLCVVADVDEELGCPDGS